MRIKTFLLTFGLLFIFMVSNSQTTKATQASKKTPLSKESKKMSTLFDGAWRNVENRSFGIMYNGYFSMIDQDSNDKWTETHAGTYIVNSDNTFTLKILYSSFPEHIGSLHTIEYVINGDTLHTKSFKRMIDAQGKDITDQMPKDHTATYIKYK